MTNRSLSAGAITALGASTVEFYHLVRMEFATTLYYTTAPRDITYNGDVYVSNAIISKIPDFKESLKIKPTTITLDFSGATVASHALPLTNTYKNVEVFIYRHLPSTGDTFLVFKGFIDAYKTSENIKQGTSKVSWSIANHWADWDASNGRLLTDENQQSLFPGDRGLQYTGVTEPVLKYWGVFNEFNAGIRIATGNARSGFSESLYSYFLLDEGLDPQYDAAVADHSALYDWRASSASEGKLPIVYGDGSITGIPVFRDLSGLTFESLWVVYALAEGECESLTNVLFDGVSYTNPSISSKVSVTFHNGSDTQTVDTALDAVSAEWTSNHRLRGICYVVIEYTYDKDVWANGEPLPQFIIKGKKCIPIGGGAAVWTNNPVNILADYLSSTRYGKGLLTSELDNFAAGSAYASATVTDHDGGEGGTPIALQRFAFNGVLDPTKSVKSNTEAILSTMISSLPWVNGKYKLVISRDDDTASFTFDEDNITDSFDKKEAGIRAYANQVYYTFIDPLIDYATSTVVTTLAQSLIDSEDNGRPLRKNFGSKYETNRYRAQNRAETYLKVSRDQLSVSIISSKADSITNETGDVVNVTRATEGWVNKLFRITGMTLMKDGGNKFELAEYDPTNFDWNVPVEFTPPANTTLTDPLDVQPPTVLVLASGTDNLLSNDDGSIISRLNVSFTASTTIYTVRYELQYKKTTDTDWVNFTDLQGIDNVQSYISPVQDAIVYDVRVRATTNIGVSSDWLTGTHTIIGKTQPPSDVTTFNVFQNGITVVFKWSAVTDLDIAGYEIRYATTNGATWDGAIPLTEVTKGTNITSADVPPGDLDFFIKAVDTTQNYSVNAAVKSLTVTAEQNIIVSGVGSPTFPGATLTNLVLHHTGKLVPKSQNLASADGYDTFDIFVINPFDTCTIEMPEYDVGFDDLVRAWGTVDGALGPGETVGALTTNMSIDHRLDAGAYDGFEDWSIGQLTLRYIKYKLELDTTGGVAYISDFIPNIDVTETVQSDTDVTIAASGTTITFPNAFHNAPFVRVFMAEASSKYVTRTSVTTTGFTCNVFDETGADVGGTIDWEAID